MAVTTVPTGLEQLAPILAQLGQNLGMAKFGPQIRENEVVNQIMTDPEFREGFASLVENASQEEGGLDRLSELINISPNVLTEMSALAPPSAEVQAETELRRDPDFAGGLAESLRERLSAGRAETRVQGQLFENLERLDVPREQAEQALAEAGAGESVARLEEMTANAIMDADLPQLRALVESAELDVTGEQLDLMTTQLAETREFINTLPKEERGKFATAMINPQYLQYLQAQEQMDLRWKLAQLQKEGTETEQLANMMSLFSDLHDMQTGAIDRILAAEEAGDASLAAAERERLRNVNLWQTMLFDELPMNMIDAGPELGLFGGDEGKSEFMIRYYQDAGPDELAQLFVQGLSVAHKMENDPEFEVSEDMKSRLLTDEEGNIITDIDEFMSDPFVEGIVRDPRERTRMREIARQKERTIGLPPRQAARENAQWMQRFSTHLLGLVPLEELDPIATEIMRRANPFTHIGGIAPEELGTAREKFMQRLRGGGTEPQEPGGNQ